MLEIKTAKTRKGKRKLEKRAPKLIESGKKTLVLHGTKTSAVLNVVLTQIYPLKKDSAVKFTLKTVQKRELNCSDVVRICGIRIS